MAAFPTSPAPAAYDIKGVSPTLRSYSQSMKRQVRSRGGQRWALSLTYPPMLKATFKPVFAFCAALRGGFNTCTIVLPTPEDVPQGSWAGAAPQVNGASQTGRTINLKNFTAGQTGVVKAGDYLKFSDSKIYMATADANSDGSGLVAALPIEPALIVSPANSESVVYTSVPFTMEMMGDVIAYPVRLPNLFIFQIDFQEAY